MFCMVLKSYHQLHYFLVTTFPCYKKTYSNNMMWKKVYICSIKSSHFKEYYGYINQIQKNVLVMVCKLGKYIQIDRGVRSSILCRTALVLMWVSFTGCCLPLLFARSRPMECLVWACWDTRVWSVHQRFRVKPQQLIQSAVVWLQEVL
jgi:hypothetical protein